MTRSMIGSERSVRKPLRSILKFLKFRTSPTNDDNVAVFRAEASRLNQALLTVRMALNPGETVATAAPRIRSEALRFDEFLANPGSISRIILKKKEFDETGFCKSLDQYGVKDPDEGQASMWYRFKASDHIVLDFVAFDQDDRPMFSILRTYSNWTGDQKCDLGNRTFHLNMVESTEAGYVNVWAGFTPASAVATTGTSRLKPNLEPVAAAATAGAASAGVESGGSRFLRKLSLLLVVLSGVVTFVGGLFLVPVTNATERETLVGIDKARVMRLADIRDFKISVDKKSCNRGEKRCRKLLEGVQRNLKSRFDRLNLPAVTPEASASARSAQLIVSYQQTDAGKKLIRLALRDPDGGLWDTEQGLDHQQDSDDEFINVCAEQFSTEMLVIVMRAKDQVMTEADLGTW